MRGKPVATQSAAVQSSSIEIASLAESTLQGGPGQTQRLVVVFSLEALILAGQSLRRKQESAHHPSGEVARHALCVAQCYAKDTTAPSATSP